MLSIFLTEQARPLKRIACGREIWIEEEDERTGKPMKWYSLDSKGRKQKHVRAANGVTISREQEA